MGNHIKCFCLVGLIILLNLLSINNSFGQCANISGQASGVSPGVGCSPHLVDFTTDYDVINLTATDIAYEVDWGDGDTDVYILGTDPEITTSVVNANTTKISLAADHTFVSGTMCRYEIMANLRFDGASCAEQQLQPVVVWDNDNVNGGTVAMDPDEYEVCAGSEVTVNFTDITDFNCTPPDYIESNPNFFARTYAFEYGTFNSIANIEVDGALRTYPYYDGVVFTTADGDLDNNGQLTYDIFVPGSANVGEQFEVTLYYWNFCNPFNGNAAAPNFGDAQIATALITIVPPPEPDPQVFDANEDFATESGNNSFWYDNTQPTQTFCGDQTIHFRQNPTANPGTDYAWDFDWDGTVAGFNPTATGANSSFSYDALTYAGETLEVGLRISRGDVGTPCIFYESIEIEIEEGPQANFALDIDEGCEEVTFNTTNNSADATDYEWSITQIAGPAGTIEDITAQENDFELSDVTISGPGTYEVELLATSTLVTSCPNSTTNTITIYDNPVANFTADDVCSGDDVIFEDLSYIPTVLNGDNIDTWEFVFNFDNTDFTTDPEATFNTQTITTLVSGDFTGNDYAHTYPAAGIYNVALRVTTDKGCISPVDTLSVTVKNNPISNFEFADNGIDYTKDLCPGTPIEIKNTSPPGQTNPAVDRYYIEIVSEDGTNDGIFPPFPSSFVLPGDSAVLNPSAGDLPNPNSGSPYTYDFFIIAEGDNDCDTREGPISITLLPAQAAEFDIFKNDPGPPSGTTADPYDNLEVYCSPYEFYFRTDANTQTFNADEYIWTIIDGVGDTLTETTVNTATNPTPERFNFNFENNYPSVSQEVFTINLQVFTNNFCVTDRNETVRLFPKPTADFNVQDSVITCDSVSYTFKAVQENIDYFWSVNSTDPSKLGSAVQDDANASYTVTHGRPSDVEPDLDFTVELYTENLVLCQSDIETMDITIPNKEVITVDVDFSPSDSQDCLPSSYTLQNTTVSTPPAGTEWEFEIYKYNTITTFYDLIEVIEGEDQAVGNKDFSLGIPYEFTTEGDYRIDLVANLVSNCRIGLSSPIDIEIYESPIPNFRTTRSEGCSPLVVDLIENSTLPSGSNFDLSLEVFDPVNGVTQTIAPVNGAGGHLDGTTLDTLFNTSTDPFIDYEITLTATAANALNCSNDSTYIVRVYQEPQIDFDITSINPACEEDYTFDFEFTTSIFPAGTEFTWNWNDGQSLVTDQDTAVSHTFVNRTAFFGQDNYNVSLTAETPNGCSLTVNETITLNPQVNATFFKDRIEGCSPLDVNFTSTAMGTGLTGNHIYEKRVKGSGSPWVSIDSVANNGAVSENFENTSAADIIYEIRYIAASSVGGCSDTSDIQEITIFPEFNTPAITGPDEVCAFAQSVEYAIPHTAGSSYIWQLPLGAFISNQSSDGDTIRVNFSDYTGDIQVQEINDNGCFGLPYVKNVTVLTGPSANLSLNGPNSICSGDSTSLRFDLTGSGTQGFDVIFNNGQANDTLFNITDGHIETVSPSNSTNYFLVGVIDREYETCNPSGLSGSVFINVNTPPTSEISGADTTCYGEQTDLIFDQTGVGPWKITYTDGNENFTFTTAYNRHFEPVSPTSSTNYSLISVTDNDSATPCTGQVSGSVQKFVYPKLEASFDVNPQDMVLPESTINLTNNTTNKDEWDYLWEFGDGTTSEEADPPPHDYGTYGEFMVRLTVTNGLCSDTYQSLVTIGAIPPIIDFNADPKEGCIPLVVQFENLTQFADPSTYQWDFGDGQIASAVENPIHVYTNPGTYNVTLSATNITGQRTELLKEEFITVNATPQASFTIPDEYRQVFTTEEVRFVNLSEGADEFIWKFGDGNESFEEEPIHAYADSGVYNITLIAINSETGCTDSVSLSSQVQVILGGKSDVPNAFTPSRAGPGTGSSNPLQNDFFLPKVEGVSQFNMKIYNRWGELLFESDDKNIGWDGYYNGVLMPQGVYVYRLELVYEDGRSEIKVGDITLIR